MKEIKEYQAIVLFGPPGSGKTTQAVLLEEKLGWNYISWGRLSRQILNGSHGSQDDKMIVERNIVADFRFPDGFVKDKMKKELLRVMGEGKNKFIIDGFPKHPQEMKDFISLLKEVKIDLYATISIACSKDTVIKRIKERVYCSLCGRFYNDTIRPKNEGVCDFDDSPLIRRIDDSSAMVESRFNEYVEEQTQMVTLLQDYSSLFFSCNGDVDELLIFSEIVTKLSREHRDIFSLYKRECQAKLPTKHGFFDVIAYQSGVTYDTHVVLVCGEVSGKRNVPVRIHSSCITGDIFHSEKCDCGLQLHNSMTYIQNSGNGVLIYLFQEGRGINIINKIKTYALQEKGLDTVDANEFIGLPAELRQYNVVKDILQDLKIKSINLISNNSDKTYKLLDLGIIVEGNTNLSSEYSPFNETYLDTKIKRMDHKKELISNKNIGITTSQNIIEIESKYLLNSKEALVFVDDFSKMGAELNDYGYEKNENYDKNKELQKEDARFRVRTKLSEITGDKTYEITYKKRLGFDDGIKKEKEVNLDIGGLKGSFHELISSLGYSVRDSYERMRRTFFYQNLKITIDEFPFGYILEIEGEEEYVRDFGDKYCKNYKSVEMSCDDVYEMLCKEAKIEPSKHIEFSDKSMPSLDDYLRGYD